MENTIESRVTKAISNQLGLQEKEILPAKNFVADLGADSLDAVEVVMALEDEFGIEITDEEAQEIRTVQDAIDAVKKHVTA